MSDKVRVYEIAEEAGASSSDVITKAKDLGIELKSAQSAVSFEDAEEIAKYIMTGKSSKLPEKKIEKKPKIIRKAIKKVETKKEEIEVVEDVKTETKIEEVKTETKTEEVKTEEVKTETKKEEVKTETKKEEVKTETKLGTPVKNAKDSRRIIPKRRGLKIVKKAKPAPVIVEDYSIDLSSAKKQMKSLSEILGNDDKKLSAPARVRKEKKKTTARAHEHGRVMNIHNSRNTTNDFKTSNDSILGEEVVLLDMGLTDTSKLFEDDRKKQQQAQQIRTTRPSAFGNRPRGLKRGKRKKRYTKDAVVEDITHVTIPEDVRVYEFAEACGKSASDVISVLFGLGMLVTKNDFLKQDELEILGEEFGIEVTVKDALEDAN